LFYYVWLSSNMEQSKAIINLFHAGEPIPEISGVIEDHAADQCCGSGQKF
jgi:hypothetical protein